MLSPAEARQLDRLAVAVGTASGRAGRRPVRAYGHSAEFHDFRAYQLGDDPRSIDWTVAARLGHLVVRSFRAEGQIPLHLLIDTSASMRLGAPSKLSAATKAAAALAYVGAAHREPLGLAMFDEVVVRHIAAAARRTQVFRIFEALRTATASGRSALNRALTAYGATVRGPGLAVVFSDFFDPDFTLDGVRFLLYRRLSVAMVQVLSDEELNPPLVDDAEITDVENDGAPAVAIDRDRVRTYQARLAQATADLQSFCATAGVPFVRLVTSDGFTSVIHSCTDAGLLELS
jgi:uncharacterized protein (DUF58 family)